MKGARKPLKAVEEPKGPLIDRACVYVTRRLGSVIMVRAGLKSCKQQLKLSLLLICEAFTDGSWQQTDTYYIEETDTGLLRASHAFVCEPALLYRIRVLAMADHGAPDARAQRVLLQAGGIWNIWGRDDGLDEPKETPLDLPF